MRDNSEISLWFIYFLDINRYGVCCGFTNGKIGRYFLLKIIEYKKKNLDSIKVDFGDVEKGQKYVNRKNMKNLKI